MNGAHLHLLLNHIPILGSVFAFCVLIIGMIIKNNTVIKTGLITTVAIALLSIPAFLTGEEAEEMVENRLGVTHDSIHEHEDAAEFAYWAMLFCGAVALGTLLAAGKGKAPSNILLYVNIAVLALVIAMMTRTGYTGGLIRHPEIDATAPTEKQHNDNDRD